MAKNVWIYVPVENGDDSPWTGQIWQTGEQCQQWNFEVLRHVKLGIGAEIYSQGVFEGGKPVGILIDHQRPGTLLRPVISRVDPGKIGGDHPFPRTRVEGLFQALLSGLCIKDEQEPRFSGIAFSSQAFSAWYSKRSFSTAYGENYRVDHIKITQSETEILNLDCLGKVEATKLADMRGDYEISEIRSRSVIRVAFGSPKSIAEAMELCTSLDLVFGFLVGFRPKFPVFSLWTKDQDEAGET